MNKTTPYLCFAGLVAASLVAAWHCIAATFSLAWQREEYTYILLVAPIATALVYLKWRSSNAPSTPALGIGLGILVIALLSGALARWNPAMFSADIQLSIGDLALAIWWIGSFVVCFGATAARIQLFPLGFLLLLAPLPESVMETIIAWLQHASALAARLFFVAGGIPATQDGIQLVLRGLTLNVARECSSIRSSELLLITTLLLAHLFLQSWWRQLLVIAAVIPLSAAKNGLRIFTLGFLATRVDASYLDGRLHHQGGVIYLAIAQAFVIAIIWILRRWESIDKRHSTTFGGNAVQGG